jgi:membrane protein DedA with SNARE-associated domain
LSPFSNDSTAPAEVPTELHPHDRVPEWLRRTQERLIDAWPTSRRRQVGAVIALVAVVVGTVLAASHLLRFVVQSLDAVAYLGLFAVNWIGAGGLLVPIPGTRIAGWLMIIQQGGSLEPLFAGVVGGLAMTIGQTSVYVAARTGASRASRHHEAAAASGSRRARAEQRVNELIREHGSATILGLSLLPNPLTTLATVSAGAMGMGFRRFLIATFAGRMTLALVLAYLGNAIVETFFPGLQR